MTVTIVVQPNVNLSGIEGYSAFCPQFNIVSQGNTADEARANLLQAIDVFLEETDPLEVTRCYRSYFHYKNNRPYPIQDADSSSRKRCQRCCHFHQSGMASETDLGYCLKWSWKETNGYVKVSKQEICHKFIWRLPPGLNTVWMLIEVSRLEHFWNQSPTEKPNLISIDQTKDGFKRFE